MTAHQLANIQAIMVGVGLVPALNVNHYRPGISAPVINAAGAIVPNVFYHVPNNQTFVLQLSFVHGAMGAAATSFAHLNAMGLGGLYPLTRMGGGSEAGYQTIYLSDRIDPANVPSVTAAINTMVGFVHANI